MDSTLTGYKFALLWSILCANRHDTLTKTLTQNSSIDSHLFRRVNCQECRPPSKHKVASWNLLCSVALDASFSCNSTQTTLGRCHFGIRCKRFFSFNLELICTCEFFKKRNCTRRSSSCNFSFLKNSLVQINSKLNSKPCDYLY